MISPEHDPLFVPGALEEVDMHFLPHDPNSGEAMLMFEEYPWGAEDYAFNQAAIALGLDETVIEDMSDDERMFHAALVASVTSCAVTMQETDISLMSLRTVKDLQELATRATVPTRFLQEFAIYAERRRQSIEEAEQQPAAPDADIFYNTSMGRFLRKHTKTHFVPEQD